MYLCMIAVYQLKKKSFNIKITLSFKHSNPNNISISDIKKKEAQKF